jgi:hypothetical protein
MKMKKGLLVVVVLLAMASLMAAMAYNTATITNSASLTIVSTDSALLQLDAKDASKVGMKDEAAKVVDGNLVFNFNKGREGSDFGLQKNSTYEWFNNVSGNYYGLFRVWNHSKENLKLNLKAENVPSGVEIYVKRCWSGATYPESWVLISDDDGYTFPYWNSNANNDYGVRIVVKDNATMGAADNMKIIVTGLAE